MHPTEPPFQRIQFYLTAHYDCSYLPGRRARSQVATPTHMIDAHAYSALIRAGFRRSGQFTYRPHCEQCHACVPVRVEVARFVPNRTQRRCLKRNRHLSARFLPLDFKEEHYQLYRSYLGSRHAGGGMDRDGPDQYTQFLLSSNVDSVMVEFRDGETLVMVAVVDQIDDGISAVYTFFDPARDRDSLGVYGVLWQIELAKRLDLPYLYLGYWIGESPKMAYKQQYPPLEGLIDGRWQLMAPA
ncbi:MAG: arginyltransferase [Thiobacillus sp.]|uniref:arginyltransferase n=1 Tax=Thiobacillus sp. TaxID=924 RepID=UPI002736A0F4|nr:arginyltransferase [Thiobacillus sp.]MDP3584638.1 arginyltransferase [Thiobacillus sp.]